VNCTRDLDHFVMTTDDCWIAMLYSCVAAELSLSAEGRESYAGGAHSDDDGAPWPPARRQRSPLSAASITRQQ